MMTVRYHYNSCDIDGVPATGPRAKGVSIWIEVAARPVIDQLKMSCCAT